MRKLILFVMGIAMLGCNEPQKAPVKTKTSHPVYNENGEEVKHDTI